MGKGELKLRSCGSPTKEGFKLAATWFLTQSFKHNTNTNWWYTFYLSQDIQSIGIIMPIIEKFVPLYFFELPLQSGGGIDMTILIKPTICYSNEKEGPIGCALFRCYIQPM